MPVLSSFSPPARQNDFPNNPELEQKLCEQWNTNANGWTQQAIVGNPWNATGASNQTYYYNPLVTDIPTGTRSALVSWNAFPNRITQYFGQNASPPNLYNFSQNQLWQLADTGYLNGNSFGNIPQNLCPQADWSGPLKQFGPYGPRGWQDEYCEWSVTRNAAGKITRIDFACENPEYWNTLWRISPQTVASLYEQTLNWGAPPEQQISVSVQDLQLLNPSTGQPVIDPSTGQPAYNPLNKWNRGPGSIRTGSAGDSGGVMHLTATPNTLQTELGLAGAATVLRNIPNPKDPQALICCSQYGQNYRHSDPHIGLSVNVLVSLGNAVSLADPIGLYIQGQQVPWDQICTLPKDPKLPAGAKPSDCWQIVRGVQTLVDPVTGQPFPGGFILHAVFQLPLAWIQAGVSFTVGDIQMTFGSETQTIQWGAQVVENIQIGLFARPLPASAPAPQDCVGTPTVVLAQPLQMMYQDLWDAYYGTQVPNPMKVPMTLASNTTMIAPLVEQHAKVRMALTASVTLGPNGEYPTITFQPGNDIVAKVVNVTNVNYAVPGNTYPSECQLLELQVVTYPTAQLGLRGVQVTNYGQQPAQAAPAFLNIVPAGTLSNRAGLAKK